MKTPGFLMDNLFYLRALVITTGLSTALLIGLQVKDTSGENTFTNYESLEVEVDGLRVKATGKNTMEALLNLLQTGNGSGILLSNETF
tara:strand:+ start:1375 stop:1638 length:264 start_codon:yes stop_codon:yes gene_type:complete